MGRLLILIGVLLAAGPPVARCQTDGAAGQRPSVLLLPASVRPDHVYLAELNGKGFNIDYGISGEKPLTWERLRQFNCLLLTALPLEEELAAGHGRHHPWRQPPFRAKFLALLDQFRAAGGGILLLLDTSDINTSPSYENHAFLLGRWGAKLPLEGLDDPVTATNHPHSRAPFIYTTDVLPSPVSDGVRGVWYPSAHRSGNSNFHTWGQAIEVDPNWTVVLRGSVSSYSEALKPGFALRGNEQFTPYVRPGRVPAPALFAIREDGGSRLGLAVLKDVFHVTSGTTWAHDRVMLDKGMRKRPSDFGKLLENTLRWLAQPSFEKGKLGGYRQDPVALKHPHFRRQPTEFFPEFDSYQNPVPPGKVFRGVVGARTSFSTGQGTVAEYAASARRAKLDFIVFLEKFSGLTEPALGRLEQACKDESGPDLVLIPGYTMRTHIGNYVFLMGYDHAYPKGNQLTGPDTTELRVQNFDAEGRLTFSDEAAKNLIWRYTKGPRNIGYFNFANSAPGSVPVRNLRLYGMLGAVTYTGGKQVEDVTAEYLRLTPQGNPPRMCVVDVVTSPAELEAAVADGHYLTHVAAGRVEDVMSKMAYGHQYGRDNVYPSSGPRIHAWAGTQRVMTFAGEPFVTSRYRIPHLAQVSSDVGLKEIRIWSDGRLWRRLLLNGAKEFRQVFEWSFDRQRGLVLEAIDAAGGRAVSTSFETWTDANAMSWCSDRQNGELWHGPFTIHAAWGSGVLTWHSIGHTWDGGSALTPFAGINLWASPALWDKAGRSESARGHLPRPMEGYTYATCVDDSVRNIAGEAWNVYAPGSVANAYHTLGPIRPAQQMSYRLRRTLYLPRPSGPLLDWHAMWSERRGGGLALFEGDMTLKQDLEFGRIMAGMLRVINFDDDDRVALWAVRSDGDSPPLCGPQETLLDSHQRVRTELGQGQTRELRLGPGGYIGTFGVINGTPSALFNVGDGDLSYEVVHRRVFLADLPERGSKGDTFSWRLLYVWDAFDHEARNLGRLEGIRSYFGLGKGGNSGIVVKRGKLLSHAGLVHLAPEGGVVEFEVPQPTFNLDIPLGLRFIGFNANWTVGQWQLKGYSPGFYSDGQNVYRNLGLDDRDMAHLAVYTKGVPLSHSSVGHPVQCDATDLIIQVTHLSKNPPGWHVAVNNPTDRPIKTVLRRSMDLPGFNFPDMPVDLPAGAYRVVMDQQPPPLPERVRAAEKRPGYLAPVDRGGGKALRVTLTGVREAVFYQAGIHARFTRVLRPNADQPLQFQVDFEARHISGARNLYVCRPWGGSKPGTVRLDAEWRNYATQVQFVGEFETGSLLFTLADPARSTHPVLNGIFEIDNIVVRQLDASGNPGNGNLLANGTFEAGPDGWSGHTLVWRAKP